MSSLKRLLRSYGIYLRRPRPRARRRPTASHLADYQAARPAAQKLVAQRLQFYNQHYQLPYRRVTIKNQTTRWGSCSKLGNLNFNYRLVTLPAHLADYIIVHELCHLKELNHSVRFWQLVAETIPDYRRCRAQLRRSRLV